MSNALLEVEQQLSGLLVQSIVRATWLHVITMTYKEWRTEDLERLRVESVSNSNAYLRIVIYGSARMYMFPEGRSLEAKPHR